MLIIRQGPARGSLRRYREKKNQGGGQVQGFFAGQDPARGSDHKVVRNLADRAGFGHGFFELSQVGSGRVGSGGLKKSHGLGRVTLLTRSDPTRGK